MNYISANKNFGLACSSLASFLLGRRASSSPLPAQPDPQPSKKHLKRITQITLLPVQNHLIPFAFGLNSLIIYPYSIFSGTTPLNFPGGSVVAASARNVGDPGSTPGSGRSPGEGTGSPLQYSCLDNLMDRGAWWAAVHEVAKSPTH